MGKTMVLNGKDWEIRPSGVGKKLPWISGWVPATVPGNIQGDLQDDCLLYPLNYGMGDSRLMDVCLSGWQYRKDFEAHPAAGEHVTLELCGVDYSGTVALNGIEVGRTEGQFNRFLLDVTEAVRDGKNELVITIDPMPEELEEWLRLSDGKLSGENTEHHFVKANDKIRQCLKGLKSPAVCSYDWAYNLYTLGVWKDVRLRFTGEARIDWIQLQGELNDDCTQAQAKVFLETDSVRALRAKMRVTVTGPTGTVSGEETVDVPAGQGKVGMSVAISHPALWWPNGYGDQPLYTVKAELVDGETVLDSAEDRIGFRRIDWELTEGAPADFESKFGLLVNGKRIRTLGSCIVTPNLMGGRVTDEHGRHYIEMAKACHMTALRQHGGQIIFPESMYRACDELGILVLLDFPIGNCVPENEPVFLKNLEDTIANIVKQLRNHASIAEWSGGNELNVYFDKTSDRTGLERERRAANREDPTRVFRDTCPIAGSRHAPWDYIPDLHYGYWNSDLKDNFALYPVMRYGEFGCQTPANLEVWLRDIPAEDRWPLDVDDPVLVRKNVFNAAFRPEYWLLPEVISGIFGHLDDLEMTVWGGQYLGGEGLRYAMDALRATGRRLGGFSSWDYNEPWPNGAGSFLVDNDGCPVMMYYFARQALSPLALSLRYDGICFDFFKDSFATLRLVSDLPEAARGLTWSYVCRDRLGRVYASESGKADIDPLEVKELTTFRLNPPENMNYGPILTELYLRDADGNIVAERVYVFGSKGVKAPLRSLVKPEQTTAYEWGVPYALTGVAGGRLSDAALRVVDCTYENEGDGEKLTVTLENTGDMTALFPEIRPLLKYRTDLFIENQFSFVPPHEKRTLIVRARKSAALSLAQTGWQIHCCNAETLTLEPRGDVLAYMGCENATSREYADHVSTNSAAGRRCADAAGVSRLVDDRFTLYFDGATPNGALLRLCMADVSGHMEAVVSVNGREFPLPPMQGLGVQKVSPGHLAFPRTATVEIPAGLLRDADNTMEIRVREGWFTWDALQILRR